MNINDYDKERDGPLADEDALDMIYSIMADEPWDQKTCELTAEIIALTGRDEPIKRTN